ncbi:uridine kinase [Galbitalea soli]|uniref:Uridine kinase n=1 Tax=Galbitalea soli TaxID=1268042 RepID=A0A7C9PLP7_9MICO|nr:uridine kinase [Galbitalea soli]NEM90412.1 uridine kinase [Galbitalea soli]NYJ31123.1 uridine kinase [Galbitalea soli]
MARWTPLKRDVIGALADEILHNYGRGRVVVAVDGREGAGGAPFADELAEELRRRGHEAFRASIDGFHRPRAERYRRGRDSAEGFYLDSYDYATFRRVLIEPFRIGRIGSFVPAAFDVTRDAAVEPKWLSGPDDALLLVDGPFLLRPELRGIWNYSIWLDVDPEVALERSAQRGAEAGLIERHLGGMELYLRESSPRTRATAIVDNGDPEHPRRVFADSC